MFGTESVNTLMVACRASMVSEMKRLHWKLREDGQWKESGAPKTARSRIIVVEATLKDHWCGMTQVAVCNCRLH